MSQVILDGIEVHDLNELTKLRSLTKFKAKLVAARNAEMRPWMLA